MTNGVGTTNGAEPLAYLAASASALILSGPLGTFQVPRSDITKVGRASLYPWLFSGVRIHHDSAKWPEDLQFKPIGAHAHVVLARLKALGYPVA